jgi:hypothetical protein
MQKDLFTYEDVENIRTINELIQSYCNKTSTDFNNLTELEKEEIYKKYLHENNNQNTNNKFLNS